MKRTLITLAALAVGLGSIAATNAGDGKAVFTANKCSTCHSVTSQGIAKGMAASKAPDLSGVGKSQNAAALAKYLKKEAKINGKDHVKKWAGSDADLQALAGWLAAQKK